MCELAGDLAQRDMAGFGGTWRDVVGIWRGCEGLWAGWRTRTFARDLAQQMAFSGDLAQLGQADVRAFII